MSTETSLPERGEIVLATVAKITDHGAYVTLDEFNDVQGFLHISEVAPGWIRSISKFVKEGEKKVLLVKKVNKDRIDIDLSLKQVSNDQKKKKIIESKHYEKGKALLQSVKESGKFNDQDIEKLEDSLYSKYDSVYDAFLDIARKGTPIISELKLSKTITDTITKICKKMRLPSVEIRGVLNITCPQSNGVEIIKKTFSSVIKESDATTNISYLGAPKYRLSISATDFKSAESAIKPILHTIQSTIEKKHGTFKFVREDSRKTRE